MAAAPVTNRKPVKHAAHSKRTNYRMQMKNFKSASPGRAAKAAGAFGRRGAVTTKVDDISKAVARVDRRNRRRINLDIYVRFMEEDGEEREGRVLNIAASGVAIKSSHKPPIGSKVICHLNKMGGYQGAVCRHLEDGFAVHFIASPRVQERLLDRIMAAANNMLDEIRDVRRHERLNLDQATHFELEDGEKHPCNVLDISLSGIGIESIERPPVGALVTVGQMHGQVVRHTPRGFGIEFDRPPAGDEFGSNLPDKLQRLFLRRSDL